MTDLPTNPRAAEASSLALTLKRAQYVLHRRIERRLRPRGLTLPQYTLLRSLNESGPLWGAELARRSFVSPQSLNGVLDRLERMGLVQREEKAWPGRVTRVTLTEKGRDLAVECTRDFEAVEQEMMAGLTSAEREALGDLLRRCAADLEESL